MELTLLVIEGSTIIEAVIWIVIAAVIFYLANWALAYIGVGEPFAKVVRVILALLVLLFLINALLMLMGKPLFKW